MDVKRGAARPTSLLLAGASLCLLTPASSAEERVPCRTQNRVQETCAPYACVPDPPVPGRPAFDTPGFCGRCRNHGDCGGALCDGATGSCQSWPDPVAPQPVYPRFHLVVGEASVNAFDAEGTNGQPIFGIGYLFQGALVEGGRLFPTLRPVALDDGGWLTRRLPRWFWSGGATVAAAGASYNLFGTLGLTYYRPAGAPFTSYALEALVQRQGTKVWDWDPATNATRVGPAIGVGILQNVFLRAAYVWQVEGRLLDHGALLVSALYMRNLAEDVLPYRFRALGRIAR